MLLSIMVSLPANAIDRQSLASYASALNGKKKEKMYAELLERRRQAANIASSGDSEAIHAFAQEQLQK